ncbi:hypothetical protein [Halomarina oriensis]|uniref:Uncharacterized protein n=1 Tax=Halomarina oriensis TaxID=671145 RepID=A0A6B0GTE4_9EURY|nr:hypothetical protein [Halomarina oriensis]MWG36969.1 hypothetical protein [Halomarina oriensis]
MTTPETSTHDRTDRDATVAGGERTTQYTLEADVTLVVTGGGEEVEPFRVTVDADSVEDAVEAFQQAAHERLVEDGPFHTVHCPPFPGYGDYRFGPEE